MKLIIAGGRDYSPRRAHVFKLRRLLEEHEPDCVYSGGAEGADLVGEIEAMSHFIPVKMFQANWDKHGKAAGPIRNAEMAKTADALFAFPGGKGTQDMVNKMLALDKPVYYAEGK